MDTTLFIRRKANHIILVQIYIDDIIFGSTDEFFCKDFSSLMQGEIEMSLWESLPIFLDCKLSKQEIELS